MKKNTDLFDDDDIEDSDVEDDKPQKRKVNNKKSSKSKKSSGKKAHSEEPAEENKEEEETEPVSTAETDDSSKKKRSRDPPGSDPLSELLATQKKSKNKGMTDEDKTKLADQLCHRMNEAFSNDQKCLKEGRPAINKLTLLPIVAQAASTLYLQESLLEAGFLEKLNEWLSHSQKSRVLPPLSLRSAIYKILLDIPCGEEELKKSEIGKTVFALSKSPDETTANKIKIRQIMEKWSRLVFKKSSAFSGGPILRDPQVFAPNSSSSTSGGPATDLLRSASETSNTTMRARAPVSHGFIFTVPLDHIDETEGKSSKSIRPVSESREKLLKIISAGSTAGKKASVRAIDASVSGRDIQL